MAKRSGYSQQYFANRRAAMRNGTFIGSARRVPRSRGQTGTVTRAQTAPETTEKKTRAKRTPNTRMVQADGIGVPVPSNMRKATLDKIRALPAGEQGIAVDAAVRAQQRAAAHHARKAAAAANGGGTGGAAAGGPPAGPPPGPTRVRPPRDETRTIGPATPNAPVRQRPPRDETRTINPAAPNAPAGNGLTPEVVAGITDMHDQRFFNLRGATPEQLDLLKERYAQLKAAQYAQDQASMKAGQRDVLPENYFQRGTHAEANEDTPLRPSMPVIRGEGLNPQVGRDYTRENDINKDGVTPNDLTMFDYYKKPTFSTGYDENQVAGYLSNPNGSSRKFATKEDAARAISEVLGSEINGVVWETKRQDKTGPVKFGNRTVHAAAVFNHTYRTIHMGSNDASIFEQAVTKGNYKNSMYRDAIQTYVHESFHAKDPVFKNENDRHELSYGYAHQKTYEVLTEGVVESQARDVAGKLMNTGGRVGTAYPEPTAAVDCLRAHGGEAAFQNVWNQDTYNKRKQAYEGEFGYMVGKHMDNMGFDRGQIQKFVNSMDGNWTEASYDQGKIIDRVLSRVKKVTGELKEDSTMANSTYHNRQMKEIGDYFNSVLKVYKPDAEGPFNHKTR
jgi:hypothetical protein